MRKFESEKEEKKKGVKDTKPHRPIIEHTSRHVILNVPELATQDVEVYAGETFLFSATVGRHGDIKVRTDSDVADNVMEAVETGESVWVKLV